MGTETKIQWCDHTFNPVRGCAKISEGCEHCYAAAMSGRNPNLLGTWGRFGTRIVASEAMWKQPLKWNEWARKSRVFEGEAWKQWGESSTIGQPESRRILAGKKDGTREFFTPEEWEALPAFRPRVFCASLADIFEDWKGLMHFYQVDEETEKPSIACAWYVPGKGVVPSGKTSASYAKDERQATFQDVRNQTFHLIEKTPHLDWMLLTKRPENVMRMVPESWRGGFPANVWIGATAENQRRFDERYSHLSEIPAKVRFWSMEPLLDGIDFTAVHDSRSFKHYFHWVITGGESGHGAQHCQTDDLRDIVSQCELAEVPCFVKQLGSQAMAAGRDEKKLIAMKHPKGGDPAEWPEDLRVREFPKLEYAAWEKLLADGLKIEDLNGLAKVELHEDGWCRGFHRYSSHDRADMMSSHRLGHRQKESMGETFWTHLAVPGLCFPTRKRALDAAARALGLNEKLTDAAVSDSRKQN